MKKICLFIISLFCIQNKIDGMLKVPTKQILSPFCQKVFSANYFLKAVKNMQFKSPEEGYRYGLEMMTLARELKCTHDVLFEYTKNYPTDGKKIWTEEKWSFSEKEELFYSLVHKKLTSFAHDCTGAALNGWPSDRLPFIFAHAKTEYAKILKQCSLLKRSKNVLSHRVFILVECLGDIMARSGKPTVANVRCCYAYQVEQLQETLLTIKKQSGNILDISSISGLLKEAYIALKPSGTGYLNADKYLTDVYNESKKVLPTVNTNTEYLYDRYYNLLAKLRINIVGEIGGAGWFNEVPQEVVNLREKAANALRSLVVQIAIRDFSTIKDRLIGSENLDRETLLRFVQEVQKIEGIFKLPSLVFPCCPKDGMQWCWETDKSYDELKSIRKQIDDNITKKLFAQEFSQFTQMGDWHTGSFGKTVVLAEAHFKKLLSEKTGEKITVDDAVECYLAKDWLTKFHYLIANIYRPSEYAFLVKEHNWLFTWALENHYVELITFFDTIIKKFSISSPEFRDALIKHAPKEIGWMSDIYKQAPDSIFSMPFADYLDSLMYILTMLNNKQEYKKRADLLETIERGEALQKKIEII